MDAIFKENELAVCETPVPKGYLQTQTHAGVAFGNGVVFLCCSPFPQIRYNLLSIYLRAILRKLTCGVLPIQHGDCDENPMLYWGEKGIFSPSNFTPFMGNPVVSQPPSLFGYPAYNSDPDLFIENNSLYLINREYIRKTKPGGKHYKGDSLVRLDMVKFDISSSKPEYKASSIFYETTDNLLSPSLLKIGRDYCIFYLDSYSYLYPDCECKLYVMTSNEIDKNYDNKKEIAIEGGDYVPWHLSVFTYNTKTYSVVSCVKKGFPKRLYQMLGVFSENLNLLKIYQTPLIDIPSYRGAAYVTIDGELVLYSTTDRYRIDGSKSVDGKDIVVVKAPFEKILIQLQTS